MEQTKQSAMRPPRSARGGKRKLTAVFLSLILAVGMTSCYPIYEDEEFAVYHYCVKIHYMDGGSKILSFDTNWKPYIATGYKCGFPRFYFHPIGECEYVENGVCRFEVLSKRDITEEYYGRKIISSRDYWDPWTYVGGTLYKLEQKGGQDE